MQPETRLLEFITGTLQEMQTEVYEKADEINNVGEKLAQMLDEHKLGDGAELTIYLCLIQAMVERLYKKALEKLDDKQQARTAVEQIIKRFLVDRIFTPLYED